MTQYLRSSVTHLCSLSWTTLRSMWSANNDTNAATIGSPFPIELRPEWTELSLFRPSGLSFDSVSQYVHVAYVEDPRFVMLLIDSVVVALTSVLMFGLPTTLLAWYNPKWALRYKVQPNAAPTKQKPNLDGLRDVILPSLTSGVFNYAMSMLVFALLWPLLRLRPFDYGVLPSWQSILLQVVCCVIIEDFIFYWMHRGLHSSPTLYRLIHKKHHEFTSPWAVTGLYMTSIEQNLILIGILAGPLLFQCHIVTFWIWLFFRNWETAEEHSGYEFPFNPSRLIPGYGGSSYHDYHHKCFNGNYAAIFPYLDHLFGTLAPGYAEHQAKKRIPHRLKTS
eukprot:TRINITY_DN5778_c0_g2_i1.p1 TRINITY_DN5778_c0_g2~~TRINITY_DN5778_c0_g2_i1.p1  ORF type:complete len:347 (-),score=37.54 TRINITY_DN5778_c0_g2_i1:237-1241(-)